MTPEMEALARRAMACKAWRWAHGARYISRKGAGRITADDEHGVKMRDESAFGLQQWDALPDITDPATLGCLLALVRELAMATWASLDAHLVFLDRARDVRREFTGWIAAGLDPAPLALALVAALEATPAREVQP